MTFSASQPCRLAALSTWSPSMHLWGIAFGKNQASLESSAFSCCGGSGIQVIQDMRRDARICALSNRWSLVVSFLDQFRAFFSEIDLSFLTRNDDPSSKIQSATQTYMSAFLKTLLADELPSFLNASRGKVFESVAIKKRLAGLAISSDLEREFDLLLSKMLWALGLVLIWHHGLLVLPFNLSSSSKIKPIEARVPNVVPVSAWNQLINKNHTMRRIMFIGGVHELWRPEKVELLDALIAFASEKKIPIWMMDLSSTNSSGDASFSSTREKSFRAGVDRKLSEIRAKPSVEWLGPQALSRLSEICEFKKAASKPSIIPDIV